MSRRALYRGVQCEVPGCERSAHARFMCDMHYRRAMNGRPLHAPVPPRPDGSNVDWSGTKNCNRCKQDLPRTAFGLKSDSRDGIARECKECRRKRARRARSEIAYHFRAGEDATARLAGMFNRLPRASL